VERSDAIPYQGNQGIKEAVGKEFPVLWRISAEEGAPGGFTLEIP